MKITFLRVRLLTCIGLLIFTSPLIAQTGKTHEKKSFQIFDAMLFKDKPHRLGYGIDKLKVIYGEKFWPKYSTNKLELPPEYFVKKIASELPPHVQQVVLDIERWPVRGYKYKPWVVESSIHKYLTIFKWFKDARPKMNVGYFGFPKTNYFGAKAVAGTKQYQRYEVEVNRVKPVLNAVDALYPAAYTFEDSPADWKRAFNRMMSKARKNYDGPVYVFMCPYYIRKKHMKNEEIANTEIPADVWRDQLELAYEKADGIVLWGGWKDHNYKRMHWDYSMKWWQVTVQFIKEKQ